MRLDGEQSMPPGKLTVAAIAFLGAVSDGDFPLAKELLSKGSVHPNVADSQGQTALVLAASQLRHDMVGVLSLLFFFFFPKRNSLGGGHGRLFGYCKRQGRYQT